MTLLATANFSSANFTLRFWLSTPNGNASDGAHGHRVRMCTGLQPYTVRREAQWWRALGTVLRYRRCKCLLRPTVERDHVDQEHKWNDVHNPRTRKPVGASGVLRPVAPHGPRCCRGPCQCHTRVLRWSTSQRRACSRAGVLQHGWRRQLWLRIPPRLVRQHLDPRRD
eukprot:COSAG06_NODE_4896_length_3875_cov_26.188030_5_plen_168_part_00